jgi:GNAT superfamily N-acetyltransferase
MTFADLYYGVKTQDATVFVYELAGRICGFITFVRHNATLFIDTIAIDNKFQSFGIGGLMMRWAETFARSCSCGAIELWSIRNRRSFYEKQGYEAVSDEVMKLGHGEEYLKMTRRILYNVKLIELQAAAG